MIFFLKMNYRGFGLRAAQNSGILASVSEATTYTRIKTESTKILDLAKMSADFFHFYGRCYNINNHLISTAIGTWQNIKLMTPQNTITTQQKQRKW